MNNFSYARAKSIQEAIQKVSADKDTKFVAGGTNLIDLWKYDLTTFNALIDINSIEECHAIEEKSDGGVRLGAFVKNAQTAYHPLIEARYPLLSKAILAGASGQIRNMATNGGNLLQRTRCYYFYDPAVPCNKREPGSGCSAIQGYNRIMAIFGTSENCIAVFPSDMCIALAALDAVVNVSGPGGERSLPFADFHRLPGDTPHLDNNLAFDEIITSIDLPQNGFAKNYSYLKLRDRNSYAFALVSVATGFELDGDIIKEARIALGGVAHKPWRVRQAEEFLRDNTASRENFETAAEIIIKDAVTYEFNSFKVELTKRAIIRNCIMALHPETQLPGAQPSA
ncbi:xanthine dehydrogenase family protein subunit M [Dyadobacter sp. 3J3]|uniref:FAD binding domain-containing protein n=1 Tax=Dyadobacter sp. 3J3 TaxID=2606600 RepID=UPI00135BFC86|nr:xanthine dehydrogenase family protein subunit M [Dyadobacter sp. 3J3]